MIQDYLRNKYVDCLDGLDIFENKSSLKIPKIVVKKECRGTGVGTSIMEDIIRYADHNKQIVTLTPSNDFGGNVNRLIQFYKRFGFKMNQGYHKNYEYSDTMIRYPKLNETKTLVKQLLREGLLTKEKEDIYSVSDFVNFAKNVLGIDDDVKVVLAFNRTPDLQTTAYYDINNGLVKVYAKDRAKIDVMRSICHELVHHKQKLDGRLVDSVKDGEDGSPIENEANAVAGEIIRKWGKMYPKDYL